MDLYEALKNGADEDELIHLFSKDLAAAKEKIRVEEAAQREAEEKKHWLEDCRNDLAMALTDYIGAVFGQDWIDEDTDGAIADLLEEFEKEVKSNNIYVELLKKELFPDKSKKKKTDAIMKEKPTVKIFSQSEEDDMIIRGFLDSLK